MAPILNGMELTVLWVGCSQHIAVCLNVFEAIRCEHFHLVILQTLHKEGAYVSAQTAQLVMHTQRDRHMELHDH